MHRTPGTPLHRLTLLTLAIGLAFAGLARAQEPSDQTPPFPGDVSPAGLAALEAQGVDVGEALMIPGEARDAIRTYVQETRRLGLATRAGRIPLPGLLAAPTNVRANNPFGDAVGETQSEVSVAVHGDTVVVGWNDSRGFTSGNTLSSFAYSTDGGLTFVDGGNVPLAAAGDQVAGDTGLDTDERGNWYLNSIYTRPGQQNISVHHGRFNAAGQLVWDTPVMASIGTAATGALDKCLLACDRVSGNVYVAYTRFTAVPRIEVVRSTTLGATWDAAVVLDATTLPTGSKQAARPFCGPNGEVYVVWEKGANTINCPDPVTGIVSNTTGVIGFSRSLDFGATFSPLQAIGTVDHSWTWSGPGDNRERANDFPDIAVDRSSGPHRGSIYVTWHESAPWTASLAAGPPRAEAASATNGVPGGAEPFVIGENVTGSSASTSDLDYWSFTAVQGQSLLFNLDPQGFNCGVSGTSRGLRLRLYAAQAAYTVPTSFPDSMLAASTLGAFAQRIVWTCPKTGTYLVRIQPSTTAIGTYTLRVRDLTFGTPSPARDGRDVVVVRSTDGGSTWSAEQRVNDDAAGLENRRPFICTDALGYVHTFWHDSRDPGFGNTASLTTVYGTTSRDGGVTWTPNYPVTDEPSFFSFNAVAIPNLGDYNQAAAWGNRVHPAWSDQRLSTGDVRNPTPPPTYTAGTGTEAYTTGLVFDHSVSCPGDLCVAVPGTNVTRDYTITNTGNLADRYEWGFSDTGGWASGATSGTTGVIAPGGTATVAVTLAVPADCRYPSANTATFTARPVGAPNGDKSCSSVLTCPVDMAFRLTPTTLNLRSMGRWVTGFLTPPAPFTADQIDLASIRLNGSVPVAASGATGNIADDGAGSTLLAKFDRAQLQGAIGANGPATVAVTGTLDGRCFYGSTVINAIGFPVTASSLTPAGGEAVRGTEVRWTAPAGIAVQSVAILYSVDDGASWTLVARGLPNDGRYVWDAPAVSSDHARVGVALVESADAGGDLVEGTFSQSEPFRLEQGVAGPAAAARVEFGLRGITPNPTHDVLHVTFSLPEARSATISLYDVSGRRIESRAVGRLGAGQHTVTLGDRTPLAAGVYVIQLTQGTRSVTTRAAVIR